MFVLGFKNHKNTFDIKKKKKKKKSSLMITYHSVKFIFQILINSL